MLSEEVRRQFLDFFRSKDHRIIPSAPMVVKNDPTLMFTNAGMNQFKDIFLGNKQPAYPRVANVQKCLRVSGKHNDLEEVGLDTYHHTMFEMLGNWSFGDYFKEGAISMAWEFLVKVMHIASDRLYATIFCGDNTEGLERDNESYACWAEKLPEDRILDGTREDNFWEMGDTGPCGPCSEIHIDLRDDRERQKIPGSKLVNRDHTEVIEIWNLVFIQYNRKEDGTLEPLPDKHVDTGMGFERLCMVMQQKKSNYDTDLFMPIIREIGEIAGSHYGESRKTDIAMRVVADHLRAVAFSIADGQIPSNNKAGYVIRRILRRAVRYGYTYLHQAQPFIYRLVPVLSNVMGTAYPEIVQQEDMITRVIREEERSFLRTLDMGIRQLENIMSRTRKNGQTTIGGKEAFELFDTYGFPFDLTALIARENNMDVNVDGFQHEMQKQKDRSRQAAVRDTSDWVEVLENKAEAFIGYDQMETEVNITKYRTVKLKDKKQYHLVFDFTPFYAESGGQVGDTGYIENEKEKIPVLDTKKENDLIIHITDRLPNNIHAAFSAKVNRKKREVTANNHTATHLLHYALRKVLGTHVEQKGSLVHPDYLRFDFSHFRKMSVEEIDQVESLVNEKIRENITLHEKRNIPLAEAMSMGAMSLFGEKYGDLVRVIQFGDSIELCGGTHTHATGSIGLFKILSESSVAAGIRRIEAVTGEKAEQFVRENIRTLEQIEGLFKTKDNVVDRIKELLHENEMLGKQLENYHQEKLNQIKEQLIHDSILTDDIRVIGGIIDIPSAKLMKDLVFQLKNNVPRLYLAVGTVIDGKPLLTVMISDDLVTEKGLDARKIVREVATEIQGGGGGQSFYATAGGKKAEGLYRAVEKALAFVKR